LLLIYLTVEDGYSLTKPLEGNKGGGHLDNNLSLVHSKISDPGKTVKNKFMMDLCLQLEYEAITYNLPPTFFARLLWTESRFNPKAISPMNAQGIAQFIPATAKRRGLDNPFDVTEALKASAWFLSDLRNEFGSLGLAAAAYNAGEKRVKDWLSGKYRLPTETINYVYAITGISARRWKLDKHKKINLFSDDKSSFQKTCQKKRIRRFILPGGPVKKWQPWGVHLAEDFSKKGVMGFYDRIKKRFPNILKGQSPMVLERANPSFGSRIRYSVIMGHKIRSEAQKMCQEIRSNGGVCLVVKN